MDHHSPHPRANFEGYYSKFDLPSGAHLAIILCTVRGAQQRPHMVSFTYVPASSQSDQVYQREIWTNDLKMVEFGSNHAFSLEVDGIGYTRWHADGTTTEYRLECDQFSFRAKTTSRLAWSPSTSTPEGLLVHLPLPLHWHVQSLGSACEFELEIPSYSLPPYDRRGKAFVHQEKNWAVSFPKAHIWIQARDHSTKTGFCCAGGQILGLEAFLLGYRGKDNLNIDFRPPFAADLFGLNPFMQYSNSWEHRTFELVVRGIWRKVEVKAFAPKGTFFTLSSPFPEGHRENFLSQSFKATIEVKVYENTSWFGIGDWKLLQHETFQNGSLEFGGGYYPPAGSKQRSH